MDVVPHRDEVSWSFATPLVRVDDSSIFAVCLGQGKAIEPGRVLPHDLPLFVLRNPFEIPLDDLARTRPGRDGMGIVGGPHDVLHPDELPAGYPDPIIDERREDLAPEVFTRRELQRRRIEIPV